MEKNDLENENDSKTFIENSNNNQNVYKTFGYYNPSRKCNVIIISDEIIADLISKEKLNPVVTELLIRGRKINISTVFITNFYYQVTKDLTAQSLLFGKFLTNENLDKSHSHPAYDIVATSHLGLI